MKLFYGADKDVIIPQYNVGNPNNDYGLGFYLTPDKEMAELWASKFPSGGYLIEYEVDFNGLNILHLNSINNDDVLKWISILISHRFSKDERENYKTNIEWLEKNYPFDVEGYDLIIGYRADDAYFDYSRDFVGNDLSLELLKEAMRLGKLGLQYVLISQKAFSHIKYLKSEKVDHSDQYFAFRNKSKIEYLKLKKEDDVLNTFIRDLMRKKK